MGKILEKLMKKYWKNAKNTGKVDEKILEKSGKFVSPKKWEPCLKNILKTSSSKNYKITQFP